MQTRDNLIAQRLFAPEQVRATGNIEKQSFWRIEHDNRRKTLAPSGDIIERACVLIWIGFDRRESRMNGTRIGKRHGKPQAKCRRARIHARQQEGAGFLGINSEGAALRRKPRSDQPIRVQARQIDREPHALPGGGHVRSNQE